MDSKANDISQAVDRLRGSDAWEKFPGVFMQVEHELDLIFECGRQQGRVDVDAKLTKSLNALTIGNNMLERVKQERDNILFEYARVSWGKVCQGLVASGFHPPMAHKAGAKLPPGGCKRCKPELVPWDQLTPDVQKEKMHKVWAAIMQNRAKRGLEKGVPVAEAGTTHELAGTGKPTEVPGLNDSQQVPPVQP